MWGELISFCSHWLMQASIIATVVTVKAIEQVSDWGWERDIEAALST